MTPRTARRLMAFAAVVVVASPELARADAVRIFRLPAEPVNVALIRFAVQGAVSVGPAPPGGCGDLSRPVAGLMLPATALRRLLPPGCRFEVVDSRSFRVLAAPIPHPAPHIEEPVPQAAVEEVVVTAERRIEPLRGSPFAVSVLQNPEIERLGGRSFDELASQVVGVTVTNLGSGRNKIMIRGLSDGSFTGRTQSTVGLYLDDVPITYNAPDPDLRLVDVERVEVLRGPQGTLYGSGSIGGIVRIVTRKPDPTGFAASIAADTATTTHGAMSGAVEAMLNVPVGAASAVRAVYWRETRGGYLDNPRLDIADTNRSRRSGVRLLASTRLGGRWRVEAGLTRQSIFTSDSQYRQGAGGPLTRDTHLREPHDNDFNELSLTAEHPGSWADFRLSAAFVDHNQETFYDATGVLPAPGGGNGLAAFHDLQTADLYVAEANLTSARAGPFRWVGGAFLSSTRQKASGEVTDPTTAADPVALYGRHDRLSEAALYGEAAYDPAPRWTLTLGGRLFLIRARTRASALDPAKADRAPRRLRNLGYTPKLRLSYALRPDAVLYAQVQEGYRPGGFNVGDVADEGLADSGRFRMDRLRSYELGAQAPLFHHSLSLRAALFVADWRNVQSDQYLPSGLPVTVNIGDGSNIGFEAEATWRPDPHLLLRGALVIDEPEITRVRDAALARREIGLPGVPHRSAAASAAYSWNLTGDLHAEAAAQVSYVGRSFLTFEGTDTASMGGYGVGRLAFTLSHDGWQAQAYLDNVTDVRGDTFSFGNPFTHPRLAQSTPLRPRTFGISLRRDFGVR